MSNLVGNLVDRFSCDAAQMIIVKTQSFLINANSLLTQILLGTNTVVILKQVDCTQIKKVCNSLL